MYTHHQTIFNQLLDFLPFRTFDSLVGQHKLDRYKKNFSAKNLLYILMYSQIAGKDSLRDIETSLGVLENNHYHRWMKSIKRSTIAYNNNLYNPQIFEELFYSLVRDIQQFYPHQTFKYYSLDSTTITLSLKLFSWAKYSTTKWAVKMHMLLDNQNLIPSVVNITTGKVADITEAKKMEIEEKIGKWDFLVYDKGYVDYEWYQKLNTQWIFFVTRPKKNMDYLVIESKNIGINWVLKDETIEIFNPHCKKTYKWNLRLIYYISPDDGKEYQFLTNNFEVDAEVIALLYKKRWQIETFFKFIKQTLKIKSFLWTSENAVKNQLRVAMIYYLILCYIKFKTKIKQWLLELSRIFSAGILLRRKLIDLLGLTPQNLEKILPYIRWWPIIQLSLF